MKDIDVFETGGGVWLSELFDDSINGDVIYYVVSNDGLDCLNCYKFKAGYDDNDKYYEKDMVFSTNVKDLTGKYLDLYNAMIDKMNETHELNEYSAFKKDYKKVKDIIKTQQAV